MSLYSSAKDRLLLLNASLVTLQPWPWNSWWHLSWRNACQVLNARRFFFLLSPSKVSSSWPSGHVTSWCWAIDLAINFSLILSKHASCVCMLNFAKRLIRACFASILPMQGSANSNMAYNSSWAWVLKMRSTVLCSDRKVVS
eukprot:6475473-Lingulodinium_polyedra.AAC.1